MSTRRHRGWHVYHPSPHLKGFGIESEPSVQPCIAFESQTLALVPAHLPGTGRTPPDAEASHVFSREQQRRVLASGSAAQQRNSGSALHPVRRTRRLRCGGAAQLGNLQGGRGSWLGFQLEGLSP